MRLNQRKTSEESMNKQPIKDKTRRAKGEISGDMTPDQVAEIVSEQMMEEVRRQLKSFKHEDTE